MPEEYKIDYTGIQVPDIESIKRTLQQFENWRRSMGYLTQEEKTEELYRKARYDQANIPEDMNSEDTYMWYNNYQHDPKKQSEFRQQGAKATGALMTIPMTVLSAGTMGWVPALTTTATGMAGGYGGYKAGEYLDKKLGTKWIAPTLGFAGGMTGGGAGYKGLVKLGSKGLLKGSGQMYGKQFMGDVAADVINKGVKQGNPYLSTYLWKDFLTQEMTDPDRAIHVSPNPIAGKTTSTKAAHSAGTKWVPGSSERSLVGDDNMIWLWEGKPYRNQWNDQTFISVPKSNSMAQTRQARAVGVPEIDLTDPSTKILIKNPITDGFERQIVVETPVQSTKGSYAWFERPSKLTEAERLGIPKGERFNPKAIEDPYYWGYKQWNARYNAAIEARDLEEIRRLRKLHFKIKAPDTAAVDLNGDPIIGYHNSPNRFTIFGSDPKIKRPHTAEDSFYFSSNQDVTSEYGSVSYPSFFNIKNPFVRDFKGESWNHLPRKVSSAEIQQFYQERANISQRLKELESEINQLYTKLHTETPDNPFATDENVWRAIQSKEKEFDLLSSELPLMAIGPYKYGLMTTDDLVAIAKRKGYDGAIFKNIRDGADPYTAQLIGTDIVGFKPFQIKSAASVTWDDSGQIIPIVKRDNFRNLDIRYDKGGKINK